MLSWLRFALMLMWYPSYRGYMAFCGNNVIVLPFKPGQLSTISLSRTAISANFIDSLPFITYYRFHKKPLGLWEDNNSFILRRGQPNGEDAKAER